MTAPDVRNFAPPGTGIVKTVSLMELYTRRWPDGRVMTTACPKMDTASHDERLWAFRSAMVAVLEEAERLGFTADDVFGVAGVAEVA